VGRIDSQKGYQYLSAIWALVSQRYPDWRLDLYGEGVDRAENQNLIPKGDHVFAHPQTSDIMDRYKESSILVLTSVYEPFGLVMAEAMSCGVPVVAFDCPYGPSEIITDGENGFLVDCFDVEAFAGKVCQLIVDEEQRRRMGRNAISSVQRFSKDKIIRQWQHLFENVVRNK
jgi:glycosyltransferase involved in cell wall biosynthesis